MSSFVTSLILPPRDGRAAVAVLGADSTATTYLIQGCRTEIVDLNKCDGSSMTMTVGPWARSDSPSQVPITDVFDAFGVQESNGKNYTFSEHCEMSGTVAQVCTGIKDGAIDNLVTETFTYGPEDDEERRTFAPYPVTITAGLDLLVAAEPSSHRPTDRTNTDAGTTVATTSEYTLARGSATETKAPGSSATPKETSVGTVCTPRTICALVAAATSAALLL